MPPTTLRSIPRSSNAEWLINEIGFDGFRFDFVKGYGAWMVHAIQELRGLRRETAFKPFAVGECWDNSRTIGRLAE